MKKTITFLICLALTFSFTACKKSSPISDIKPATAEQSGTASSPETKKADEQAEDMQKYTDAKSNEEKERTSAEASEIDNNLKDIEALIDDEAYDDARMIIKSLKTRQLSAEENNRLLELEKKLIKISD